jgi:outer membrane cobalamin receptor
MQILWIAILTLISGRVVDGKTGEPIDRARVSIGDVSVVTGSDGTFIIPDATLPLTLNVTAVGYATSKKTVRTSDEITIVLVPEGAELTENVTVTTDPFEGMEAAAASERSLNKAELQSTSMVLVGDALRAAQSLPGVVANNDLRADFTVRGASPEHVAVVVDGVLTDNFVHTFAGADSSERLSLSLISQDTVSDLSIMPGAFPSSFGGSTAAITSIETRDGNRVRPTGRFGTGIITTNGVVDGPLAGNRGAWLLSGRTSYADYVERLVRKITGTATKDDSELNFSDASFNVNYDLSPTMNVGIRSVFGVFGGNQGKANREKNKDDPDAIDTFDSRNHLLNVRLSYAPSSTVVATVRGFLTRGKYRVSDLPGRTLDSDDRTQYGVRSDLSLQADRSNTVELGIYERIMQAKKVSISYRTSAPRFFENFDRSASESAAYIQDMWKVEPIRLSVTAGGRLERNTLTRETSAMPRLALTWRSPGAVVFRAGMGAYRQLPDFNAVFGFFGNRDLKAERAVHYNLSAERSIGSRTRVVAEMYDREETRGLFSFSEPHLFPTGEVNVAANPFQNSLTGFARGADFIIQRRSANGLSGWVSYGFMRTRQHDAFSGLDFVADADQRHTLNMSGSWRLRPTFSVSSQFRYGSGQPIPGFLRRLPGSFEFSGVRNTARLDDYSRMDVRASRSFPHASWKWTLSGEVLNVLNHKNYYNVNSNIIRFRSTGLYFVSIEKSFGVLPSAGVYFEF